MFLARDWAAVTLAAAACASPPVTLPAAAPGTSPAVTQESRDEPVLATVRVSGGSEPPPPSVWSDAGPVLNSELRALRARAQRRVLGGAVIEDEHGEIAAPQPLPNEKLPQRDNGNALGNFVRVQNETALRHFHEQLERLATGRDDGKVRILAYGASHTQGDFYTGYLRHYLQSRFGNGGPGFVHLAQINPFYRMLDLKVESSGFRIRHAQRKDAPVQAGRYGLLGAAGVAYSQHAFARVTPRNITDPELAATRYELLFDGHPQGGELDLVIDSRPPIRLSSRAETPRPLYYSFTEPLGWHEVEVRPAGSGSIRLFGLTIERGAPGVVLDTLGINGTRASNMLRWDHELWFAHVRRRDPDLILLAYGTNEAVDRGQPIDEYRANLVRVLELVRTAAPSASCLLVGPGDFPKEVPGGWVPRPRLTELIEAQRTVAEDLGCGFWDSYAFMGGEGSMHRWANAYPRMASPDHIHLTARGYVKLGMALGDALMRPYDAFHLDPSR